MDNTGVRIPSAPFKTVSGVVGTRSVEKTRTGVKQSPVRTGFGFTPEVDSDKAGQKVTGHAQILPNRFSYGAEWHRLTRSIEEGDTRHG